MDTDSPALLRHALARAAHGESRPVRRWLLEAGRVDADTLLNDAVLARVGLSPEFARRCLAADQDLRDECLACRDAGWRPLALGDDDYPALLAALEDAPPVLFVRGEAALLADAQIAMVGSRHPSADGRENARRFARALAAAGFTITSGLALGVDGHAHRGALETGNTVAVLGCGPDRIYPARHAGLAEDIVAAGGALVTEFVPGTPPVKANFPRRNRIISGLSLATVVVEANLRSGSLITARMAGEQGREVFAIPGSIHNPVSRGCHKLLREGAHWLESMEDILEQFDALHRLAEGVTSPNRDHALLKAFTGGTNSLDALHQRTGLPLPQLNQQLAELEIDARVERVPGGYRLA